MDAITDFDKVKTDESDESCMDVIRGMRRFVDRQNADPFYHTMTMVNGEQVPNLVGDTAKIYWRLISSYADRFENALKRMLVGLKDKIQKDFLCGSNYALRKSIQNIRNELIKNGMGPSTVLEANVDRITSEALETPIRNVDRFADVNAAWRYWVMETQSAEYQQYIHTTVGYDLELGKNWEPSRLEYFKFIKWLFEPLMDSNERC